jgi:hypothetical protein
MVLGFGADQRSQARPLDQRIGSMARPRFRPYGCHLARKSFAL